MNFRSASIVTVLGLTLSIPVSFAQTTPLSFAQRRDVSSEIQLQPNQRAALQALGPICEAQCQVLVAENFNLISDEARLAYGALPAPVQEQVVANQEGTVQQEVQLNAIDDVLANAQMDRFRQLWTQFQGVGSLTSGAVSEAMDLSDAQLGEIQDLQIAASQLTNECLGNSSLTPDQQAAIIQNINNGVIDQSINILEDGQLQVFVNLCGEPCQFDPPEDSDQTPEENGDAVPPALPTDVVNQELDPAQQETDSIAVGQSARQSQLPGNNSNSNQDSSTRRKR